MSIGRLTQDHVLEDDQHIKHCTDYKYLGMKITQDETTDQAIKERDIQVRRCDLPTKFNSDLSIAPNYGNLNKPSREHYSPLE